VLELDKKILQTYVRGFGQFEGARLERREWEERSSV